MEIPYIRDAFLQTLEGPSLSVTSKICFCREINKDRLTDNVECAIENYFDYFSNKTYVVGIQKNRLNETFLLSIQNSHD